MKQRASNSIDVHIGTRIRMRRLELKISQADLGTHMGISFQQIQKYEKGVNRIGGSRMQQLSTLLKVPVWFFYEGAPGQAGTKHISNPADVSSFMTSPDGIAIAQAVQRLPADGKLRRIVRDLILSIVDGNAASAVTAPQRRAA
jgi:transcriptional regulator with XRE-family HTH domain